MSSFVRHLHNDLRSRAAAHSAGVLPEALRPTGQHKEYPRFSVMELPEPQSVSISLSGLQKVQENSVMADLPIPSDILSTLFFEAIGVSSEKNKETRSYPSAGNYFPIETYILTGIDGGPMAAHHYNPSKHVLEILWPLSEVDLFGRVTRKRDFLAGALIIFTSVWERVAVGWGDYAYAIAQQEVGHMAQNMYLCASVLNTSLVPVYMFDDSVVSTILDLDVEREQPLQVLALSVGK